MYLYKHAYNTTVLAEISPIFSCPGNNETLRHILHTSREFLLLQKIESRLLTEDFVSSHFELDLKYNQNKSMRFFLRKKFQFVRFVNAKMYGKYAILQRF